MFKKLKNWNRRRKYVVGCEYTRFIARDVVRDIRVESIDKLDDGLITVRIRKNNVLYTSKGLTEKSDYGEPEELDISNLWKWSGQSWGGLADGTSIVDENGDVK